MSTRSPAHIKGLLERHGLRADQRLGQHFMVDENFARAVARVAAPDERTVVLEIGPGTGLLTRAIFELHPSARILAVELDAGLVGLLRQLFSAELASGRLTLLHADCLAGKRRLNPAWTAELLRISAREDRPRRVLCANLPYNIATPLIANLVLPHGGPEGGASEVAGLATANAETLAMDSDNRLRLPPGPAVQVEQTGPLRGEAGADAGQVQASGGVSLGGEDGEAGPAGPSAAQGAGVPAAPGDLVQRLVATIQLEPAERLLSPPGKKGYGPLSAYLAVRSQGRIERRVGKGIFWPPPRVDSAVIDLALRPWEEVAFTPAEAAPFLEFLHGIFRHRRKSLRALLRGLLPEGDPRGSFRAEQLGPTALLELYRLRPRLEQGPALGWERGP